MRTLKILAAPSFVAALAMAASAHAAAERHYDCTKAGNANKAECKAAAAAAKPATPAPAPAAKAAPVAAAKPAPAPAPVAAAKPAKPPKPPKGDGTRSAAQLANDNKMKACGAKWGALSAADKQKWDAKGAARKDKNGKPETGWIAYSVDCRKGAA